MPHPASVRKKSGKRKVAGWFAVGLSTALSSFWAFWGAVENFHEGWYAESLWLNLAMMLVQYMSPMFIFISLSAVSIVRPRLGASLHGLFALLAIWFFQAFSNAATFLIILPLIGLGVLYWFGQPRPRRLASSIALGVPLFVMIFSGINPAIRVSQRVNDGNFDIRYVDGNGVSLYWAPEGPGWPSEGESWYEAQRACQFLKEEGLALASAPLGIWRLPSVEEAVRSMVRHGHNSGGVWDAELASATYDSTPDKETPLWNVHSRVIYWWTATEIEGERAYIIVYDGKVWPRSKRTDLSYLGFRCVKEAEATE